MLAIEPIMTQEIIILLILLAGLHVVIMELGCQLVRAMVGRQRATRIITLEIITAGKVQLTVLAVAQLRVAL